MSNVVFSANRRGPGRSRRAATGIAIVAVLLAAGCSSPDGATGTAADQQPVAAASTAAPGQTTAAHPKPAGPAPKAGTVAWYVSKLPAFDPPPAPTKTIELPMSGPARQFDSIPVGNQKVAFITIDDGWLKDPGTLTLLRAAHIPFTMFLTTNAIKSDPSFFTTLQGIGGVVEDHTITHGKLTRMSYAQQQHEICGSRATLARLYRRAPVLMRAPYGLTNANTLEAAASCGIRANLFWDEYALGGKVGWQRPGGIHPGDLVLMHFDKEFKANFLASLEAFHKAGITPALLEDYLVTNPPTPVTPATPGPTPAPTTTP
jgi:peptidoglycan/xylan/chitin deacetylase (PgdA/CDA1 family)